MTQVLVKAELIEGPPDDDGNVRVLIPYAEGTSSTHGRVRFVDPAAVVMPTPVRVQLSRAKGWRMPADTVKVDRSTRWGNPFSMAAAIDWGFATKASAQAVVVDCFRAWQQGGHQADNLWQGPESDAARERFRDLSALRGKNLACWCKPGSPCHADVLLELANAEPTPETEAKEREA